MKTRLLWGLISGMVLMMSTSSWVSAMSGDPGNGGYTAADKEYYLTEAEIAFIRPGLVVEIMDVVIPADLQPEVTLKLTDPGGMPLDIDGVFTPGPIMILMTLSYIPVGEKGYIAYTTRIATSDITGESAEQASYDFGGVYTDMGDGVYLYKFATVLPDDYSVDATTSLGAQARRNLSEWDLGEYVSNELYHFIPSGVGTPMPRDMTTTATCNRCHDPLSLHGGWRTEVGVCVLCHNPTQSIDPDTMDSVDMPYMIHKIHAGVHLENGYTIIGYRGLVFDFSEIEFTTELNDCEVCHTGGVPVAGAPLVANPNPAPACDSSGYSMTELAWGNEGNIQVHVDSADGPLFTSAGAAGSAMTGKWVFDGTKFFLVDADNSEVIQEVTVQNTVFGCANNPPGISRGLAGVEYQAWMTRPSRMACGSCHDDIDFAAGEGHLAQADDSKCATCHQPTSGEEYDLSVTGAHTVNYQSAQLGGVLVQIVDIASTAPGDKVKVTFSLSNKWGALAPSELGRLLFSINGPNEDFSYYIQENAIGKLRASGPNWTFTFASRLPTKSLGSFTLGVEGRISGAVINEGKDNEFKMNDQMQNLTEPFAVTDTDPVSRRMVVDDALCENCHANLSLHGANRHDANGYCQTCHMPSATDAAVRPEGTGEPESIDFRYMIHKIHRGVELENGYIVYGYKSSLHDFSDYVYVGDLRNCEACHVEDSYMLPLNSGLEPVTTPRDFWTPMLPETAACLSCHDSESTAVHADSNSTELGEACATCHGVGKTYSVEAVHAR